MIISKKYFLFFYSFALILCASCDLTVDNLKQKGTASDQPMSVNALGFIIFGHALHHLHVLKERYGI